MGITELLLILAGAAGLWVLCGAIKNTIAEVRTVRCCCIEATAEILSWRVEEDSDNPTRYIPTIRYAHHGRMYETEFRDAAVTGYQKEREYSGDTMTIFLDRENPAVITPGNKRRTICRCAGNCIAVAGVALFFVLVATICLLHKLT